MIKELNQKYFKNHPLKEFSAARFEYSLYTMDGIEKLVNNALKDKLKPDSEDFKDAAAIDAAAKPEELLKYMRKGISGFNRQKLRDKILEYEVEMQPLKIRFIFFFIVKKIAVIGLFNNMIICAANI